MRRRVLMVAVVAISLAAVALSTPRPSLAAVDASYTTDVVTAARITSGQTWETTTACQAGTGAGYEYRCAFEFGISIPSTAKITSAKLKVKKTAGPGCFASDCPVDIMAYNGNGSSNLPADVAGTASLARIFYPDGSFQALDVSADLQTRVSNGLSWMGYRLQRDASSPHNPDVQTFDTSGTTRVTLEVSYIAQPVDVTVHVGGGPGVITSSPGGISCGEFCTATFEYAEPVTLTATPGDFTVFQGWQGGECDGVSEPVCQFIVPALDMTTTANFLYLGPPVTQPPNPTPIIITEPPGTPPPLTPAPSGSSRPTAGPIPTGGPMPTGGPAPTGAPAPTDVIASDGTIITPPPPTLPPGVTPAPTIIGLGDDTDQAGASGGIPLPLVILLILLLGGAVGGGVYWYTKRQGAAAP